MMATTFELRRTEPFEKKFFKRRLRPRPRRAAIDAVLTIGAPLENS